MIVVEGRPFLAWTQPNKGSPDDEDGAVGPDDDPDTIREALGLRPVTGAKGHKRACVMVDSKVWCYASPSATCVVGKFWESLEAAPESFHDADLAGATMQVNAILDRLREAKQPGSALSFLLVENALSCWRGRSRRSGPMTTRTSSGRLLDSATTPVSHRCGGRATGRMKAPTPSVQWSATEVARTPVSTPLTRAETTRRRRTRAAGSDHPGVRIAPGTLPSPPLSGPAADVLARRHEARPLARQRPRDRPRRPL